MRVKEEGKEMSEGKGKKVKEREIGEKMERKRNE